MEGKVLMKAQLSVRLGCLKDLAELKWGWEENFFTQEKFIQGIKSGEQEFWVVEDESDEKLVGELHIFWNSIDPEEANGKDRAYLCAFRIHPDLQANGIGKHLMKAALDRIANRGYKEATICVEEDADELKAMYNKWGFTTFLKTKDVDLHNFNGDGSLKRFPTFAELYLYQFENKKGD